MRAKGLPGPTASVAAVAGQGCQTAQGQQRSTARAADHAAAAALALCCDSRVRAPRSSSSINVKN